jgi:hypothetical protein
MSHELLHASLNLGDQCHKVAIKIRILPRKLSVISGQLYESTPLDVYSCIHPI